MPFVQGDFSTLGRSRSPPVETVSSIPIGMTRVQQSDERAESRNPARSALPTTTVLSGTAPPNSQTSLPSSRPKRSGAETPAPTAVGDLHEAKQPLLIKRALLPGRFLRSGPLPRPAGRNSVLDSYRDDVCAHIWRTCPTSKIQPVPRFQQRRSPRELPHPTAKRLYSPLDQRGRPPSAATWRSLHRPPSVTFPKDAGKDGVGDASHRRNASTPNRRRARIWEPSPTANVAAITPR